MTADEVAARVESGLRERGRLIGAHGISGENIDRHRVGPELRECGDPSTGATLPLWIIVDECPASETQGYLVVFDETHDNFGLAVNGDRPTLIGLHGTLIDTLNGM